MQPEMGTGDFKLATGNWELGILLLMVDQQIGHDR